MTTPDHAPIRNRQWIYRTQPTGMVGAEHYALIDSELDRHLAEGEVLIAARHISVDPYMRINQSRLNTWQPPHPLNTVQGAAVVAQVLASNAPAYAAGDWVSAYSGWQTHAKVHASTLTRLDPAAAPVTTALGVLGMPGRTAWFGLTEAGKPKAGEVVVVSGAAGAVGSLVVQFAKKHGCTVLGIAGGAEKCRFVTDGLGADFAIDYRAHSSAESLAEAIRSKVKGVDVYFDNVGGMVTDAIIPLIQRRARIIICGQISQYSGGLDTPELGPRFLHHMLYQRATIQGILSRDYVHRMDEMLSIVAPWVASGEVVFEETVIEGFEQLPNALNQLFTGHHHGKLMVSV
ncbi:MAG: NADP-dependent oxidoreductase [Burkholderiales bacterium]|nr:NADP-dependent oxidoreductase [Burkholderiales bacterium]